MLGEAALKFFSRFVLGWCAISILGWSSIGHWDKKLNLWCGPEATRAICYFFFLNWVIPKIVLDNVFFELVTIWWNSCWCFSWYPFISASDVILKKKLKCWCISKVKSFVALDMSNPLCQWRTGNSDCILSVLWLGDDGDWLPKSINWHISLYMPSKFATINSIHWMPPKQVSVLVFPCGASRWLSCFSSHARTSDSTVGWWKLTSRTGNVCVFVRVCSSSSPSRSSFHRHWPAVLSVGECGPFLLLCLWFVGGTGGIQTLFKKPFFLFHLSNHAGLELGN